MKSIQQLVALLIVPLLELLSHPEISPAAKNRGLDFVQTIFTEIADGISGAGTAAVPLVAIPTPAQAQAAISPSPPGIAPSPPAGFSHTGAPIGA